eukprot:6206361-Pleurochrysis_carterae.AAC.3
MCEHACAPVLAHLSVLDHLRCSPYVRLPNSVRVTSVEEGMESESGISRRKNHVGGKKRLCGALIRYEACVGASVHVFALTCRLAPSSNDPRRFRASAGPCWQADGTSSESPRPAQVKQIAAAYAVLTRFELR